MNIEGDYIVHDGEFIYVYNGDNVVAMVRPEIVNLICISEKLCNKKENIK
jgi:UDP-N-acetylglucosamine pyrophosphorylase